MNMFNKIKNRFSKSKSIIDDEEQEDYIFPSSDLIVPRKKLSQMNSFCRECATTLSVQNGICLNRDGTCHFELIGNSVYCRPSGFSGVHFTGIPNYVEVSPNE